MDINKKTNVIRLLKERIEILENGSHINLQTIKVLQKKNEKLRQKLDACINHWENLKQVLFMVDS